jgi:hypothetical protein
MVRMLRVRRHSWQLLLLVGGLLVPLPWVLCARCLLVLDLLVRRHTYIYIHTYICVCVCVCVLVHVLLLLLVSTWLTSLVTLVTRSILTQTKKCGCAPTSLHIPYIPPPGREADASAC